MYVYIYTRVKECVYIGSHDCFLLCPQLAVSLNIGLELLQISVSLLFQLLLGRGNLPLYLCHGLLLLLQLLSGGLGVGLKLLDNPNQSIASDYGFSLALAFLCEM